MTLSSLDFIRQFTFGGLVSIGIGSPKASKAVYLSAEDLEEVPTLKDVYFSPAMRQSPGDEKKDVLGTAALWVDYDHDEKPRWTYPPTYAVFSGHGWHCYWFLDVPCLDVEAIENANKILDEDLSGDGCWNANRVLRVPGTTNNKHLKEPDKYSSPVPVEIRYNNPGLRYSLNDISKLKSIPKTIKHKIATGDSRGHRSRSERDWKILTALVSAGLDDGFILTLFENQPCGDKHKESGSDLYLLHSLERIHEKVQSGEGQKAEDVDRSKAIVAREDGYWVPFRKGLRRVSTFILEPNILLDGSAFGTEDSLVCNVHHDGYVWPDITFNRDVFNSSAKMAKATPVAAWQWLGHDDDVKELLPFLLEELKKKGLPRVAATKTLGLHNINGRWLFLGDKQVLSKSDVWFGFEGPLAYISSNIEHPSLEFNKEDYDVRILGELIPKLNEPEVIWPMIGWYTAAMLKPWIESIKYRFPILSVVGTRGSGKTTLIQRVFMPMWGQDNPTSYDSGTTKFVTLTLMGSSNAVPIAFSEFRVDAVQRFLRVVLLAYDTGHDPRGNADKTTTDYPLQAPFSLDGEDLIDDAAARERIIVARLHPHTVEENTVPYNTFKEMQHSMGGVPQMGTTLIQRVLGLEPDWHNIFMNARDQVFNTFPSKLPDRVRNNHVVTYFGMMLWGIITESEVPSPEVLRGSISAVFDMKAGRSRTLSDDMVEHIINTANGQLARYKYVIQDGVFFFQLAPAYADWVMSRRRQGRGTLEQDAMKSQLSEAPYYVSPQVLNGVWMYGVDLGKASQSGLDVPSVMNSREIRISF